MTPRERQLATIRHELTDRISADAICIENAEAVAAALGLPASAVPDRLGIDGRLVAPAYTGALPQSPGGTALSEWGTSSAWQFHDRRAYPLAEASSVAQVENYPCPDAAAYDYEAAARQAHELGRTYAVRGPYWKPLFCQVCDLMSMEEAMVRMAAEPAIFEAALERVFQHVLEYCRRMLRACGDDMPIFCLGDDFATQRGMMISPELWRRFLRPRYARLFELARGMGKHVWFHSCGDVTTVLGDLIDIGVDVWETVQLHTLPISPEQLKRRYGRRLTFFGGVSTQSLPFATPEAIRRETRRCIEALGRGGGYICGPDHHIKPDVSVENTLALFDTCRDFRGHGYTLTGQK